MKSTQYAIRSSTLIYSNIIPLKFTVTSYRKKKAILSVLLYEEINKTCAESFSNTTHSILPQERKTISIKVEHFRKANVNKGRNVFLSVNSHFLLQFISTSSILRDRELRSKAWFRKHNVV